MSSKTGRGYILNRSQMAGHLGVAMTTLDDWVKRGCPFVEKGGRGQQWKFNSAEVRSWRDSDIREEVTGVNNATIEELKRRKLEAETEQAELDLDVAKELVAPIEQIERAMSKAFGEVRASLRNVLPGRAVRRLIGEINETKFKKVLLEEVDQALEALSNDELIYEDDLDFDDTDDKDESD